MDTREIRARDGRSKARGGGREELEEEKATALIHFLVDPLPVDLRRPFIPSTPHLDLLGQAHLGNPSFNCGPGGTWGVTQ